MIEIHPLALSELAVMGGSPAFSEKLHVGRPNIPDRKLLHQKLDEILDRKWLTNYGQCVQELESELRARLGVRHAILVCNATAGLEILLRAIDIKGEVLVPAFTFVATAHCVQWVGLKPVFCDVLPNTHCIDPEDAKRKITDRTSAILAVHLWGRPSISDKLLGLDLPVLFDAAHAFDCEHDGVRIGNFGVAEVFSFHATKVFSTQEGGAITTNDDELAARIRLMLNFGFAGYDQVVSLGTNAKMSEFCAAWGLTALQELDVFIARNRANLSAYQRTVGSIPGIKMFREETSERRNHQYAVFEVDSGVAGLSRDELLKLLWSENVMARRYFYPGCHRMEPYASGSEGIPDLPVTESLCDCILLLPNGTAVGEAEIARISAILACAVQHPEEVMSALGSFT